MIKEENSVKHLTNFFFLESNISIDIKETYLSINNQNVIRGMHFQLPPYDMIKMISVIKGSVLDLVIDLRKDSDSYLKLFTIELSAEKNKSLLIPQGIAHGFKTLEPDTIVLYNVTNSYNKQNDISIKYDSINFDWKLNNPILSERDKNGIKLEDFIKVNPF